MDGRAPRRNVARGARPNQNRLSSQSFFGPRPVFGSVHPHETFLLLVSLPEHFRAGCQGLSLARDVLSFPLQHGGVKLVPLFMHGAFWSAFQARVIFRLIFPFRNRATLLRRGPTALRIPSGCERCAFNLAEHTDRKVRYIMHSPVMSIPANDYPSPRCQLFSAGTGPWGAGQRRARTR